MPVQEVLFDCLYTWHISKNMSATKKEYCMSVDSTKRHFTLIQNVSFYSH